MKRNQVVTAQEILDATGETEFEVGNEMIPVNQAIGKVRIRVEGITGISHDYDLINLQKDCERELEVVVGLKSYKVTLEEEQETDFKLSGAAKIAQEKRKEIIGKKTKKRNAIKRTIEKVLKNPDYVLTEKEQEVAAYVKNELEARGAAEAAKTIRKAKTAK